MKRANNLEISLDFSTLFLQPQASRSPSSLRLNTLGISQIHPFLSVSIAGLLSTQDLTISHVN